MAYANSTVKAVICNLSYTQRDMVDREVTELINYTSLNKLCIEEFVHNNGVKQNLLKVYGTLPIVHRGATYNIPLSLWIPYNFPDGPPICFVTPTHDMAIKPRHKHVSSQGMVYLPYLSKWSPYRCNLIALSTNLQSVFGPEPPVYAKPRSAQPSPLRPGTNYNQHHTPNRDQPHYSPVAAAYHPQQPTVRPGAAAAMREVESKKTAAEKEQLTALVKSMLYRKVSSFHSGWVDEVNHLHRLKHDLCRFEREIECEEGEMKQELDELQQLKTDLQTANVCLQSWLDKNSNKKPINLVEAVEPATGWTKQMMESVAKDCAIDDTLYSLDRALGEDLIDFKMYFKQVRKLLRQQFFHRALAQKIKLKQKQLHQASGNLDWSHE